MAGRLDDPRTIAVLAGALLLFFYSSRALAREAGRARQMTPSIWDDLEQQSWFGDQERSLAEQAFNAAEAAGVPPDGFTKQLAVESAFIPTARSSAGAVGLALFMIGTAIQYDVITMPSGDKSAYFAALAYSRGNLSGDELAARIAGINSAILASSRTTDHRTNPTASINGGLRYMQVLHRRYEDEAEPWSVALAAYNWGPGNVDAWLAGRKSPPAITRRYVEWIAPYYGESPAWAQPANV